MTDWKPKTKEEAEAFLREALGWDKRDRLRSLGICDVCEGTKLVGGQFCGGIEDTCYECKGTGEYKCKD